MLSDHTSTVKQTLDSYALYHALLQSLILPIMLNIMLKRKLMPHFVICWHDYYITKLIVYKNIVISIPTNQLIMVICCNFHSFMHSYLSKFFLLCYSSIMLNAFIGPLCLQFAGIIGLGLYTMPHKILLDMVESLFHYYRAPVTVYTIHSVSDN